MTFSLQEYLKHNYSIEMPRNTEKTISFKHPAIDVTVRGANLGADYTSKALKMEFDKNIEKGVSYAELRFTEKPRTITERTVSGTVLEQFDTTIAKSRADIKADDSKRANRIANEQSRQRERNRIEKQRAIEKSHRSQGIDR